MKFWNSIQKDTSTAEILIYGIIGLFSDADAASFVSEFKTLENKYPNINVRLNCVGGDVFEGIAMYNCIAKSNCNVTMYIDGIAASMGAVLALCGKPVKMSRYARLMVHGPSGSAQGDADDFRNAADEIDSLKNTLAEMLSTKTGKTVDEIKSSWMAKGVNKWFTADQALAEKLIDDIYDGIAVEIPSNVTNANDILNLFTPKIINQFNPEMKNIAKFVAVFAIADIQLSADANEELIATEAEKLAKAYAALKSENAQLTTVNADLKTSITDLNKAKAEILVQSGLDAKKYTAEQKETFLSLAIANYDETKKVIDSMKSYQSITNQLGGKESVEDRKDWKFTDWMKKDPKGLESKKTNDVESYKALYKAEYNVEPKL